MVERKDGRNKGAGVKGMKLACGLFSPRFLQVIMLNFTVLGVHESPETSICKEQVAGGAN